MTCLTLLGPCKSSMRAFKGRPSVFNKTCTEATEGLKGMVKTAPPWMILGVAILESLSVKFSMPPSLMSASTPAWSGYSICAVLRMAMEFWEPGEAMTARKGRRFPSSRYTAIFWGVLSGPCQSSTLALRGRPSVLRWTCTESMAGVVKDQVLREPPCTLMGERVSQTSLVSAISPPGLEGVFTLGVPTPVARPELSMELKRALALALLVTVEDAAGVRNAWLPEAESITAARAHERNFILSSVRWGAVRCGAVRCV
mmetsp:Transcript_12497/g.23344  ORF Transcript_12497/g.23344 Transcript_12497/m.23344 type:complete len:257 (+) Transcript_12497:522-1292(+)